MGKFGKFLRMNLDIQDTDEQRVTIINMEIDSIMEEIKVLRKYRKRLQNRIYYRKKKEKGK